MKRLFITFTTTVALMLMGTAFAETKVTFDKFKNVTNFGTERTLASSVTFDSGRSAAILISKVDVVVGFSCKGRSDSCRPTGVELLFVAHTRSWRFIQRPKINLLVDGMPADAGTASWDGSVLGADNLVELVDTTISPELLAKLAKAKTVDVQIGLFELSLTNENLAAIKDIATHLTQSRIAKDNPEQTVRPEQITAMVDQNNASPEIKALLRKEYKLDEECRGGHGDDPRTDQFCKRRDKVGNQLNAKGWCYGESAPDMAHAYWAKCQAHPIPMKSAAENAEEIYSELQKEAPPTKHASQ